MNAVGGIAFINVTGATSFSLFAKLQRLGKVSGPGIPSGFEVVIQGLSLALFSR
jgi:hypothetical protein